LGSSSGVDGSSQFKKPVGPGLVRQTKKNLTANAEDFNFN
jgi:hypothetical protein